MEAGLLLFIVLSVPSSGAVLAMSHDQAKRDLERKTYRLRFPADLPQDAVTIWLKSISGTLHSNKSWLEGTSSAVFEVWSTGNGFEHILKLPWKQADYVIGQLNSHVPGLSYEIEQVNIPRREWRRASEFGLSRPNRPLRLYAGLSSTILGAMQVTGEGEAVMMQYVISPASPQRSPTDGVASDTGLLSNRPADKDELAERRAKLDEPNFNAVLRVASDAKTDARAMHLVDNVRKALASTHTANTRYIRHFATLGVLQKRIDRATTPYRFTIQLSASELTALVAWPIGSPFIAGLPPALSRRLPPPANVPSAGRIVGRSNMSGSERLVAIPYEHDGRHVYVLGSTGSGKSVLLGNMLKQDIDTGHGVIVLETKGDLFYKALDYIPKSRIQDVIVVDTTDTYHPVGFNILTQGSQNSVVDRLIALFAHLYSDTGGLWQREVLYHGLHTLMTDKRMTFADLVPLLVPMTEDEIRWSDDIKRSLTDRELRNFWQRFDNKSQRDMDRMAQPVLDRVWQLNARAEIRNIIGQSESTFDIADVIKNNKILLVNLSGLSPDSKQLMGTIFMDVIWQNVQRRDLLPERVNYLYADEFQTLVRLPIDPEEMLSKARSYKLGMVMANQHLAQLPSDLRSALMPNTASKISFQLQSEDATAMAREYGKGVSADDLQRTGRYQAWAMLGVGQGSSTPFSMNTLTPAPPHGLAKEVLAHSRAQYGRTLEQVEKQISERRSKVDQPVRRRSRISGT